jgi:thioredoxin reductase
LVDFAVRLLEKVTPDCVGKPLVHRARCRFKKRPVRLGQHSHLRLARLQHVQEALFLAAFASKIHVIHRRDAFRASRIMANRVMTHPKITVEWNSIVDEVIGNDNDGVTGLRITDLVSGRNRDIPLTGVLVAIGQKPNSECFASFLETDKEGYIIPRHNSTYTNG